mgnify:CR=1 FL=1
MKDIFSLLNISKKNLIAFLALLCLFLSLFEFLTFSLIEPIINLFSNNQDKTEISFFKFININTEINKITLVYTFFICFLLRSMFSLIIIFLKNMLSKNINDNLSNKLFTYYLKRDYLFFIKNTSSFFNSNIIKEVDNFAIRLMDSFIYLLTDTVIIITVITFLTISYPVETMILFIISSAMFVIYYLYFRNKLKKLGQDVTKFTSKRIKFLENSFYIIQNIKLDQSEKFFIKNFKDITDKTSNNVRKINFILESPKSLIEITMLFVIFALIFNISVFFNLESSKLVPLLGLFVFGMFRILPSFNRVLVALSNIKASYGSIEVLQNQLKDYDKFVLDEDKNKKKHLKEENFNNIKLKNIYFEYNNNNPILENIDLEINKDEILGIIGENGTGKSTLLNILSGLLKPQKGNILLDDLEFNEHKQQFTKNIGYIPQKIYLSDDTIKNNITLGEKEEDFDEVNYLKAINLSKLDNVIEKLDNRENTYVGERGVKLSGGQQQRLGIARAIYKNPKILILDESTNALDFETEEQILNEICLLKKEIFIVLVSHNKKIFDYCDKIVELKSSKLKIIK